MWLDTSKLEAVIFDMDGVLFLSTDCHEQAYRETLQSIGIHHFSYSSLAGMRTDEAIKKVLAKNKHKITETLVSDLVARKRSKALELLEQAGVLREGCQELVEHLTTAGYRLVLASSASPQTIALFLRKSGLGKKFEFILDGSMVEHAKPAPDIYQLAIQKLKLEPSQCVVVEDAVSGIQAAQAAGTKVVALTGTESQEKLMATKPEYIVDRLSEIGPILL